MADDEDEDILDSWEDADESEEFERRMEVREKSLRANDQIPEEVMNSPGAVTILKPEHTGRTEYTPQIKILKRAAVNNVKPPPKQMTEAELKQALKMKEAEYQAARNRILGENYDETRPRLENEAGGDMRISIIKNPNRSAPGSPSPSDSNQNTQTHVVIRQPTGPDDSSGFTVKR